MGWCLRTYRLFVPSTGSWLSNNCNDTFSLLTRFFPSVSIIAKLENESLLHYKRKVSCRMFSTIKFFFKTWFQSCLYIFIVHSYQQIRSYNHFITTNDLIIQRIRVLNHSRILLTYKYIYVQKYTERNIKEKLTWRSHSLFFSWVIFSPFFFKYLRMYILLYIFVRTVC